MTVDVQKALAETMERLRGLPDNGPRIAHLQDCAKLFQFREDQEKEEAKKKG